MKRLLVIAASAGALLAVSSAANAQECLNGWKMMKDQIPVRCDELAPAFAGPPEPLPAEPFAGEEPLTTGSINPPAGEEPSITGSITPPAGEGTVTATESEQPPQQGGPDTFAASREECQPGQQYMLTLNSGDRPVSC